MATPPPKPVPKPAPQPITNRERFQLFRTSVRDRLFSPELAKKRQDIVLDRLVLGLSDRLGRGVQDRVTGFLDRMNERFVKLRPR
jgi:hypothetical protein